MFKIRIKNKVILYLFSLLFTLTSCFHKPKPANTKKNISATESPKKTTPSAQLSNKEEHVITIWVHGTRSSELVHKYILKKLLFRKIGMHPAAAYEKKYNRRKIAETLAKQKTKRFVFDNFYFFGWSGILNHKKRKAAAIKLHAAILALQQEYFEQYGVKPKIRLITHSHGGNVALCLAKINSAANIEKIKICELIMLACPVQKKTCHFINNDTFEKIYSLYSSMDIIQVMDPQGLPLLQKYKAKKPFFSQRRFAPNKKLTQAKIKINGFGVMHVGFLLRKFITAMPYILDELDQWQVDDARNPHAYKKNRLLRVTYNKKGISFNRKILKTKVIRKDQLAPTPSEALLPSAQLPHDQSAQVPKVQQVCQNEEAR